MDRDARKNYAVSNRLATWGRGRAVRLEHRVYEADVPIHLTICADTEKPFLIEPVARMVCQSIERTAEMLAYQLYVYCLMPDHLHVMLTPAESRTNVSVFLNQFKSFTTNRYWRLGGTGRLWQPSARDRVKRAGEALITLVRYIADNPVRAGLVKCWMDWPYTRILVDVA